MCSIKTYSHDGKVFLTAVLCLLKQTVVSARQFFFLFPTPYRFREGYLEVDELPAHFYFLSAYLFGYLSIRLLDGHLWRIE